jgi:hypothetical protein
MGYNVKIVVDTDNGKTKLERTVFLPREYSYTNKKYKTNKAPARKALEELLSIL